MKKFSSFLNEAEKSFAAKEAERLQLTHVGYGKYADVRGNVTHMSKAGKLIKLTAQDQGGQEQGGQADEEGGEDKVDQGAISITFGRFNPPTTGHEALVKKVSSSAKGGEYRIYPSRTQDPKKNPLDPGAKIKFMKQSYPDHAARIMNSEDMKTIFDVLGALDGEGYSEVNIVVGGDRVSEFTSLSSKYNGKLYNFEKINVVSAGNRDPDAEGVEGMSASKLRKAAADDDYDSFKQGLSKSLSKKQCEELFAAVQQSMSVEVSEDFNEVSYQLYEIAPKLDPKGLREAYFEQSLFEVGTYVENVNTGIIGKVVSRGSNYLIYIDEHDNVFRTWLKDLVEVEEGFDFTPAGEMGTKELDDYMRKLTPGEFIRKINKNNKTATPIGLR
tara:strand:- start:176 stop:1333 length:1158 start_codon:yes stop_codon:yes gene_type:complete